MKAISNIALLLLGVTLLTMVLSGNMLSRSPWIIAVQLIALSLSVWARHSFPNAQFSIHAEPKDGQLLQSGPYKFIRHPMYASALLLIWSGVLGHGSPVNLVIGVLMTTVIAIRIVIEEHDLRTAYPDYSDYAHTTKLVIPGII